MIIPWVLPEASRCAATLCHTTVNHGTGTFQYDSPDRYVTAFCPDHRGLLLEAVDRMQRDGCELLCCDCGRMPIRPEQVAVVSIDHDEEKVFLTCRACVVLVEVPIP